MSIVKLVNQARQLLEVLAELERGRAYDLSQLTEHVGVESRAELRTVAECLQKQGCVELLEQDGGSFVALRSLDFDPGLVVYVEPAPAPDPNRSAIAEAKVELFGGPPGDRGAISTTVEVAPLKRPEAPSPPTAQTVGDLTIAQVLRALATAVEGAAEIGEREKGALLEHLEAVATNPSIRPWLSTPLRRMV